MGADSDGSYNPVLWERSPLWEGEVPAWAAVAVDDPRGEVASAGRKTRLFRVLQNGPRPVLGACREEWGRLFSEEPKGLGPFCRAVSETFRLAHRALTREFPLTGSLRAGPDRTLLMGILNVTPDSFSDGGRFSAAQKAVDGALAMEAAGADIVDIGGESTRPGADPVSASEELERVMPVLEGLRGKIRIPLSIDTTKAAVARQALGAGAEILNDVQGLRGQERLAEVAAERNAAVVAMHMQGEPRTMQADPRYDDLFGDITAHLRRSVEIAATAGVDRDRICVDPGIGFGKTVEHNLHLIRHLHRFLGLGCPVLLGPSRKAFIGAVLDRPVDRRGWGTAAAVAAGVLSCAHIVRVHDVAEMTEVVRLTDAVRATRANGR
jgi:dihydropteroate synthase